MPEDVFLGFDFGFKRIGVAVGQKLTGGASPVSTVSAKFGLPDWDDIQRLVHQWHPAALIVGLPTCIDEQELYTTEAARQFAEQLHLRFNLPVHFVDERLTTVEARERLYAKGGYRKIKKNQVDELAACIILEQWLNEH